jgi:Fic family protein
MSEIIKMLDDRLKQLDDRQQRIEQKIDHLSQKGCSKAESHDRIESNQGTIFARLLQVELAQAEGRGRMAIAAAIAGALLATAFAWIGRHLP